MRLKTEKTFHRANNRRNFKIAQARKREKISRNQGDDDGYLLFADLIQCKYSVRSNFHGSALRTEGIAIGNLISLRLAGELIKSSLCASATFYMNILRQIPPSMCAGSFFWIRKHLHQQTESEEIRVAMIGRQQNRKKFMQKTEQQSLSIHPQLTAQ